MSAAPATHRRILSLDGGGIRCMIAIEVLAALEQRLAEQHGDPQRRLCQHFDLIAGTSGGAIVASAVALGLPMRDIRDFVVRNARNMFRPASWYRRLQSVYDKTELERNMQDWFGADTTLGSPRLQTLLLLVMRNWSTDSAWLLSNHPGAPFNARHLDDCNLDLKLWELARASSAAPYYYEPDRSGLGEEQPYEFVFVDGGLTGLLNPAFKAFLYATTQPYGLEWPTGEACLSITSIGAGEARFKRGERTADDINVFDAVLSMPGAMLQATVREQDVLCRTFGRCLTGEAIDLELGDMKAVRTACEPRLFSYHRVSPDLSSAGLQKLGCGDIRTGDVMRIDAADHVESLSRIGQAIAARTVESLCQAQTEVT